MAKVIKDLGLGRFTIQFQHILFSNNFGGAGR